MQLLEKFLRFVPFSENSLKQAVMSLELVYT
jgi:hypothetical protein